LTLKKRNTEFGQFPKEWRVDRVDSVFHIQQGKQVSKKNREGKNQAPFLRTKNVFWNKINLEKLDEMHFSTSEMEKLTLKTDDLLVCEGGDIGRTAIWNGKQKKVYYQNHLHRLRKSSEEINSQYALFWFWYAFKIGKLYHGRGNVTTIPNLSRSKLAELPLVLPSVIEQTKIAQILSMVQQAIEDLQQLIDITTELKKTLMQQLFTKGLHNETQKQTEIGPVPESWGETKLEEIASLRSGGTPRRTNSDYWLNGEIPWVKTGEIKYQSILTTQECISEKGLTASSATLFNTGTLLMAMYGQGVTRGRVGILGLEAATNQACVAIIPRDEKPIQTKYLYYYFQFLYKALRRFGHGANQKNLSATILKSFPVMLPDINTQKTTVVALNALDNKIRLAQNKADAWSQLFKTLLNEMMTGKISTNEMHIV